MEQSKITFLVGIQDGTTLLVKELREKDCSEKAWRVLNSITVGGFHFSDTVKQVDSFYSDSANVRIPILEAYKYSILKMKGATNSDLEQITINLRQTYNQ